MFKNNKTNNLLVLIGEDKFAGLNLQYCNNIIMEGNYNIQHTTQAIGRINRIGMNNQIIPNIYLTDHRIISDNDYKKSISEFLPLHEFKINIFKQKEVVELLEEMRNDNTPINEEFNDLLSRNYEYQIYSYYTFSLK